MRIAYAALLASLCALVAADAARAADVRTVYSSLPLAGSQRAAAQDVRDGELLALQQAGGRVGDLPVRLVSPYAIFGYEAMALVLDAIRRAGPAAGDREAVRRALFATRNRASVLGTYSIDRFGDTTLRSHGGYRVSGRGNLSFERTIDTGRLTPR